MRRRLHTDEELINTTVGALTLVEPVKVLVSGKNRRAWKCRCKCGNEVVRDEHYLVVESKKSDRIPSCGCVRRGSSARGQASTNWKGCGDLNSTYYNLIKKRCEQLGREFAVTIEFLWDLYLRQEKKCFLSGLDIEFATFRQKLGGHSDNTASLDRVDSDAGYLEDNVQWVHKDINLMKNYFGQDYFIEMCRLVAEKHPREQTKKEDGLEAATAA